MNKIRERKIASRLYGRDSCGFPEGAEPYLGKQFVLSNLAEQCAHV